VIAATISDSDAQAVGAVVAAIWGVTLAYVWILASKLRRLEQQLAAAQDALDRAQGTDPA
jgi:CcmD family protein